MKSDEGQVDLLGMLQALREEWRFVVSLVAGITILAAVVAFFIGDRYRAQVVVSPVTDGPSSGASALSRQLGGLAGLIGINLSDVSQSSQLAVPYLQSRALVERFIQDNELLPVLFEDQWDEASASWKQTWRDVPTLWKATDVFVEDILRINVDQRTGLVTLSVEWTDPTQAAAWANGIVALANEQLRQRDLSEAERNAAYLREQIDQTSIVGIQAAMFNLLENEMKTIMLANARAEYAFAVVDPAVPPEEKSRPNRPLIIVVGMFFGAAIAAGVVALRRLNRSSRRNEESTSH
jgi:uncharacterized protein involved in exopolysaccharide biosynthesis